MSELLATYLRSDARLRSLKVTNGGHQPEGIGEKGQLGEVAPHSGWRGERPQLVLTLQAH